jgi:type III secretory pathway component EscV
MGAADYVAIGLFVLSAVVGAIGWLLRQKDAAQEAQLAAQAKKHDSDISGHESQIASLFIKHDMDAAALHALELKIAANHYERTELDRKFDRLDQTFKDGFSLLAEKLDKMNNALLTHLGEHVK